MTNLDLAIIVLGSLGAMQTAWIHYQVNKNACGGTRCQQVLISALKLTTARLQTQQELQDARWHSPES